MFLLKSLPLLSIITTLIYICGWAFASKYFDIYGLGLATLNISFEQYLLFGFVVFYEYIFVISLLATLLCAGALSIIFCDDTLKNVYQWWLSMCERYPCAIRPISGLFIGVAIPGLIMLAYLLGTTTADSIYAIHWSSDYPANPRVVVVKKPRHAVESLHTLREVDNEYSKGCFRLLRQTSEAVYVFIRSVDAKVPPILHKIPRSEIASLQILPERVSCQSSNEFS